MFAYAAYNPVHYIDPDGRQTSNTIDISDFNQKLDLIFKSIPGIAGVTEKALKTGATSVVKNYPLILIVVFVFCLNGDSVNTNRQSVTLSPKDAKALLNKMESEIRRIQSKDRGNKPSETYALIATKDGHYPNLRTGEVVFLKRGDVYKYGETSDSAHRYPDKNINLNNLNLRQITIFCGTKEECMIVEKIKLYGYYLDNGSLPPGNKIFR